MTLGENALFARQELQGSLSTVKPDAETWERERHKLTKGEQRTYLYIRKQTMRRAKVFVLVDAQRHLGVSGAQIIRDIKGLAVKGLLELHLDVGLED